MSDNSKRIFTGLDLLDVLFYNKNKSYGAYALRRAYPKQLLRALLWGLLLLLLAFGIPYIAKAISGILPAEKPAMTRVTELGPPPSIDANKPPPPPPPKVETPPPPIRPTVKFVPPIVKKDAEVTEEEKVATADDLKEADPSTKTQEGDPNSVIIADVQPTEDLSAKAAVEEVKKEEKVFTVVEQMPQFPGGEAEMLKFIYSNIKYPSIARDNGVEGTVVVSFIVDKEGKIGSISVVRDIGAGCGEEAITVVKKMPQWSPGKQRGTPVSVKFNLPIKFKLE